jgi:hypothetical protein
MNEFQLFAFPGLISGGTQLLYYRKNKLYLKYRQYLFNRKTII